MLQFSPIICIVPKQWVNYHAHLSVFLYQKKLYPELSHFHFSLCLYWLKIKRLLVYFGSWRLWLSPSIFFVTFTVAIRSMRLPLCVSLLRTPVKQHCRHNSSWHLLPKFHYLMSVSNYHLLISVPSYNRVILCL